MLLTSSQELIFLFYINKLVVDQPEQDLTTEGVEAITAEKASVSFIVIISLY